MSPVEVPQQIVGHLPTGRTLREFGFRGPLTLLRRVESLYVCRLTTESHRYVL